MSDRGNAEGEERPSSPQPHGEISTGGLATDPELSIKLRQVAGVSGLSRPIRHPRVQKPGLALAGHFYGVVPTRVQVLGETELSYLDSMNGEARSVAARGFFTLGLSCVVVTSNREPPKALVVAAEASATPLFVSDGRSSRTINAIHAVLDDRLAPQTSLHGVLVDVFGVGLLLLGKSGIGKSECALALILRGHRLVADDVVMCDWRPPGMVFGAPADLLRHHIEVRGLGVLNVKSLFGVTSVRERKRIEVVVQLAEWEEHAEYDRLGLDEKFHTILGTPIRELTVPVRPGRDMGTILEIAARNELLRKAGTNSSLEFMGRLEERLVTSGDAATTTRRGPGAIAHPPVPGAPQIIDRNARFQGEGESSGEIPLRPSLNSLHGDRSNESSAWIPAVRPKGDE